MNAQRRKDIARAEALFEDAKAKIEECVGILEDARDEEQEYYDIMPESLQGGEKGEAAQEAVSAIEDILSQLELVGEVDFSAVG